MAVAAGGAVMAGCGGGPQMARAVVDDVTGGNRREPLPLVGQEAEPRELTEDEKIAKYKKEMMENLPTEERGWIENGEKMKTPEEQKILDTTETWIDITYSEITSMKTIREIEDTRERLFTLIGWLGVMDSGRYDHRKNGGRYACNTYVIDVLVGMLGHEKFGSKVRDPDKRNGIPIGGEEEQDLRRKFPGEVGTIKGEPFVHGIKQELVKPENIRTMERLYTYLSSNNFDGWLKEYGVDLGWEQVTDQDELKRRLKEGYVGIAVTPKEEVKAGGEDFTGHGLVVCCVGDELAISQSTNNILLEVPDNDNPKVNPNDPTYNFWVCKLPPPG